MSGHTPGKWSVTTRKHASGMDYCVHTGTTPPYEVFSASDDFLCVGKLPEGRVEANARLIAAAPELLEALEREYEVLADTRNDWPGRHTGMGQARLCNLRDLIAKATGRSEEEVQDAACARAAIARATGETP